MAIRQKGTKWQVDVTVAGVRAPRINCETKAEAQRIEADFRARLMAGVPADMLAPTGTPKATAEGTLDALLTATHKARWAGTKGEATALYNGGVWVTELGAEFHAADLTPAMVDDVVDGWAAKGAKPSTINRKLSALSTMLKVGLDRGIVTRSFKLPWKKEYEGRLRYLTDAEVNSLLGHVMYDPAAYHLMVVALDTGLRLGELQRMIVRDVDLKAKRLDLGETKGNKRASIPLTKGAWSSLTAMVQLKRDHDLVFPSHLTSRHLSRVIDAWKRAVGLPKDDETCFHTLRHTCCSRLVQRGVPILVVKDFMRHANIETTMRYAHLAPDSLDLAREALERKAA